MITINLMQKLNFKYLAFLLILIFFINYRDFLNVLKISFAEDLFSYYKYQNIIFFYVNGDVNFKDYIPVNTRFLGLFLQYLIYELVPCINMKSISFPQDYYCATYSLVFLNYIIKILLFAIVYIYLKLKINFSENLVFLGILVFVILLEHLEQNTMDRIAIFYLFLCLLFDEKKYFGNLLILCSFLVNEKIILILGIYYFIKYIILFKTKYKYCFISICFSLICYLSIIFILINFYDFSFHPYYEGIKIKNLLSIFSFYDLSILSNFVFPMIICLSPYIISLLQKNKFNLDFSYYEILIIISLLILSMGGGLKNLGRYFFHTLPIWLPLFTSQIYFLISKISNKKSE